MTEIGNNNNVIQFPNPDEVIDDNSSEVVAKIWLYDDNYVKVWVSYNVDNEEKVEWLKRQAGESLTTLFNYLNGLEEDETWEGQVDDEEE